MSRFFLFALLSWITGNPLLALLVIIALALPGWWAGSRYAWRLSRRMRTCWDYACCMEGGWIEDGNSWSGLWP